MATQISVNDLTRTCSRTGRIVTDLANVMRLAHARVRGDLALAPGCKARYADLLRSALDYVWGLASGALLRDRQRAKRMGA